MQLPPLVFTDVSLLFAVCSIILLITAELSSSYYGQTKLDCNREKLKNSAYAAGVIFLITAVMRMVGVLY
ncbi:MAG: hypothetical protein NWF01_08120 [Candidatus Bathyarchaeota archaeon]|nr:hypothetical protein [Candidatus Bathyarchaeota archaeon]